MQQAEYIAALRPTMTPEFLAGLLRAVRTYGWRGDYVEVFAFLEWCVETVAGFPRPMPVDPYEVDDAEWWAGHQEPAGGAMPRDLRPERRRD